MQPLSRYFFEKKKKKRTRILVANGYIPHELGRHASAFNIPLVTESLGCYLVWRIMMHLTRFSGSLYSAQNLEQTFK